MNELDLAQFVAAVHTYAPKWEATAIQWQLTLGPDYEKRAAGVVCETGDMVGWFSIWTSGEAELEVGNLDTGVVDCVHYDLANPEELSARLDDLTRRLTEQT
ncbi:hypothetical protein [Amycolatopsis decaplanina]|uniref:Uncharacterized protein n=1 Tax=Amycolatopsis decaplanina DSM 44594 TaxID=1284240 RepID=M2Z8A7_9PSEU|nr:hypothetical protein [Amycolatopsis decaplanina]EME63507.1 hypothetical protein H074_06407 [Amycolatopsis decaplanina DSM 44594]